MKQNFFSLDIKIVQTNEDPKETQKMKTLKAQTICF